MSRSNGGHGIAPLTLGPVHHIRLTVTDLERSKAFYTFGIALLPFKDPDGIQLEICAPL